MSSGEPATDDCGFLGGRLTLRQFRSGHRAGTDAVLLAAAAEIRPGQHLVDVGSGVGAAAVAALARVTNITATLVERDKATAALAAWNLRVNGFDARGTVLEADLFDTEACRPVWERGADVVICNPPFFDATRVRASSDPGRRAAHVLDRPLNEWMGRLLDCLRSKGRLVMIHRPEALPQILEAAGGRVGALEVRPVHAKTDGRAIRIILTGVLGSRAPLALAPPLILHAPDGTFTSAANALHMDAAALT